MVLSSGCCGLNPRSGRGFGSKAIKSPINEKMGRFKFSLRISTYLDETNRSVQKSFNCVNFFTNGIFQPVQVEDQSVNPKIYFDNSNEIYCVLHS